MRARSIQKNVQITGVIKNKKSYKTQKGKKIESKKLVQLQGFIYVYNQDRRYGYLMDRRKNEYFFKHSALLDDSLHEKLKELEKLKKIPVFFKPTKGPRGPVAIQVLEYCAIEERFKLAVRYADDGNYAKAIAQVKQVLAVKPNYPQAKELQNKWIEYARLKVVPKGSNPYARAKRAHLIERNLEKAAQLFRDAIRQNDKVESAVKDLALLMIELDQKEEAIRFFEQNRHKISDKQSFENILISLYRSAGKHRQAIELLQKKIRLTKNEYKKVTFLWSIGNSYLNLKEYKNAELKFREVLKLRPDSITAQRNIALCLSKQGRFEEAENILNRVLDTSIDTKAAQLIEAIKLAKETGKSIEIDEISTETELTDFSRELSKFTHFFLNRCNFEGVAPERIKNGKYVGSERDAMRDIDKLESFAKQLGARRPRDRSNYYLSAARLSFGHDYNLFYRYLGRSFASMGDSAVLENKPLDTAREWYSESLSIYQGDRSPLEGEQDAKNALVRFLFSTLGQAQIPLSGIPTIGDTIEKVLNDHPNRDKIFDAIVYLVLRSKYAANHILNRLFGKKELLGMALGYLRSRGIDGSIKRFDDFVRLWDELRRIKFDEIRKVLSEFQYLERFHLTTAWLENVIKRTKDIEHRLFFDLDLQRIREFQAILELALDLCKQAAFEEQERLCIQVNSRCRDLLNEIESSPTKLSIEGLYSVVKLVQEKVEEFLEEIYHSSTPQITLRLPVESYSPDNNHKIEIQIVAENKMGCSPAESLELVIQEEENFFTVNIPEIKLYRSLRGGEQQILVVPLDVTRQALQSKAFSLTIYAQYRSRAEEIKQTAIESFSIRLYSEDEFEVIENPYATYAEGGIVGDPNMFYGREELIRNIADSIQKSCLQSKCVIVFGQKRAGKSSILHHLKCMMEKERKLLILDLGNIGSILDENSTVPLLYQILWSILRRLEDAIEDRVDAGFSSLDISFPSDREFYAHPAPLTFFKDIFDKYKRRISKKDDWSNVRIVILMDEFSYIYAQIVAGNIPELFMKNWKALLQENYFNAVLAGQDVMPKFKQRFPNEFGTTQDERVTYLRPEDAAKLIDEPIRIRGRHGESRYRERAIERILQLTAGSPFYIQIICNRLVEYMNRKRAPLVTDADVEQVKNELIRGVNALSLDKFENLINSGDTSEDAITDEDVLAVLTSIAANSQTGLCQLNTITCETHFPIDTILDDLVKRDIIEKERERYYRIRVGLFREWLIVNR
jgi:tetratricopeptide (TPR) repeat protein